jgi:dynein heavy chain
VTSENLQDLLEEKLVVKRKSLCPRSGAKAVIYEDDINIPKPETYGAQPPIELLRQTIDQGGFLR